MGDLLVQRTLTRLVMVNSCVCFVCLFPLHVRTPIPSSFFSFSFLCERLSPSDVLYLG